MSSVANHLPHWWHLAVPSRSQGDSAHLCHSAAAFRAFRRLQSSLRLVSRWFLLMTFPHSLAAIKLGTVV